MEKLNQLAITALVAILTTLEVAAQDIEGPYLADQGHVLNGWAGEVWQKGSRFRCKTLHNAFRRSLNRQACKVAISCYVFNHRELDSDTSTRNRWRRVGAEYYFLHMNAQCGWASIGNSRE